MEVLRKNIPLSPWEAAQAEAAARQGKALYALPQPVFEFVVRRRLKDLRARSLESQLPEVPVAHPILKTELPLDAGAGCFRVYVYRRQGLQGAGAPLLYVIHGGGFIGGTHLANDGLLRKLCDEHDILCASVDYHLSPEARYPIALEECALGLAALLEEGPCYQGVDPGAVFIAGDSAGGNLAAALCLRLKNRRGFTPKGQILLYPVTQMETLDTNSYRAATAEAAGMRKGVRLSRKLYARNSKDYRDIYFSPLGSTARDDPAPTPALLLLAEKDGLLDDGILYGEHLAALGGRVRCVVYEHAYHAFMNGLGDSPCAADAYGEMVDFIGGGC
jgi:acetyl esterase